MAPRRPRTEEIISPDAIESVMEGDKETVANSLEEALGVIGGISDSDVRVVVYRASREGPWEHVKELSPPINTSELVDDLKTEYGGGKYALRVLANGRIKTTKYIQLAVPKTPIVTADKPNNDLFMVMMNNQNAAADRQMQMMAQMSQQQAAMMAAMNQNTMTMMTALIPAIAGGKESTSAMVAALAPLLNPNKGGLGETVEIIKAVRDLIPEGGGGDDSLMAQGAKALLPILAGAGAQAMNQPQRPAEPYAAPAPAARMLPARDPAQEPVTSGDPIISVIGDDIKYFLKRQIDPEVTADAIMEVIERNGITEDELLALVSRLSAGDWTANLLAEGIDVRGKEQWFARVLQLLSESFPDSHNGNNTGGPAGGDSDIGEDETA